MSNFLEPLANATLVWHVASGYALDSETGNYVATTTGITYYASLRQKRAPSTIIFSERIKRQFIWKGDLRRPCIFWSDAWRFC